MRWLLVLLSLGCAPRGVTVERVPSGEGEGEGEGQTAAGEGEGEGLTRTWSHPRQLRGAWLTTVFGIDWPSNSSAGAVDKQDELRQLIDDLHGVGANAVMFQVRPESDALYASSLEPWSRFVTGSQGQDPGFDPLAVAIEQAHQHGMELHAWFNPYRGLTSSNIVTDPLHITNTLAEHAIAHGNGVWMDPSAPLVRAHVVEVITDVLSRYDIDGVVFDDYFYPYPDGNDFDDDNAYQAFLTDGGTTSKGDWRRDNVNALIVDVAIAIEATAPAARFFVSPFGIYRPGIPAGISGLDAYEDISCDAVRWLQEDWVDGLLPQLYWPSTQTAQAFGTLVQWWSSLTDDDGRLIMPAINWANHNSSAAWDTDEFMLQWQQSSSTSGSAGVVGYHARSMLDADELSSAFSAAWSVPALPPENPRWRDAAAVVPPAIAVTRVEGGWQIELDDSDQRHVIYRDGVVSAVVAAETATTSVTGDGLFAITTVDAANRESVAVVINR